MQRLQSSGEILLAFYHNIPVGGLPGLGIRVETCARHGVVEQSLQDGKSGLSVAHIIVSLRVGQARVRTQFKLDVRVPVDVLAGIDGALHSLDELSIAYSTSLRAICKG